MKKLKFLLLALLVLPCLAFAACGNDPKTPKDPAEGFTHVVEAGESIQAVIDEAEAEDSIYVRAGTYSEQLVIDKDVTIVGADGVVINGPADYNDLEKVAYETGETQTLDRYGLVVVKSATVTLKNITIKGEPSKALDTYATDEIQLGHKRYMGVLVHNADVTLEKVTIKDILIGDGSDQAKLIQMQTGYCVYVDGLQESTLTVTDCKMENFQKGGIYDLTEKCTLTVTGTTIVGRGEIEKVAQNGIYSYSNKDNITITGNTITDMKYSPKDPADQTSKSTGVYVNDADLAAEIESNNTFTNVEQNVDHE